MGMGPKAPGEEEASLLGSLASFVSVSLAEVPNLYTDNDFLAIDT